VLGRAVSGTESDRGGGDEGEGEECRAHPPLIGAAAGALEPVA
jgi:hypothetical protein